MEGCSLDGGSPASARGGQDDGADTSSLGQMGWKGSGEGVREKREEPTGQVTCGSLRQCLGAVPPSLANCPVSDPDVGFPFDFSPGFWSVGGPESYLQSCFIGRLIMRPVLNSSCLLSNGTYAQPADTSGVAQGGQADPVPRLKR